MYRYVTGFERVGQRDELFRVKSADNDRSGRPGDTAEHRDRRHGDRQHAGDSGRLHDQKAAHRHQLFRDVLGGRRLAGRHFRDAPRSGLQT